MPQTGKAMPQKKLGHADFLLREVQQKNCSATKISDKNILSK